MSSIYDSVHDATIGQESKTINANTRKRSIEESNEGGDLAPSLKRTHIGTQQENDDNGRISSAAPIDKTTTVTETEVGIDAYVNANLTPIRGGIIKQRYSDFHVREVAKDGHVCRITSLLPPTSEEGGAGLLDTVKSEQAERDDVTGQLKKQRLDKEEAVRTEAQAAKEAENANQTWTWSFGEEQIGKLKELLGNDESFMSLQELWTSGPKSKSATSTALYSKPIVSKEQRTAAHQLIRELFAGHLITETVEDLDERSNEKISTIRIRWGSGRAEQRRSVKASEETNSAFDDQPYIHFLLQKTNRDNQDALNILARSLGLLHGAGGGRGGAAGGKAVKELSVAGTKDKRGITVQQVALKRGRKTIDDVWRMANGLKRYGKGGAGKRAHSALDALNARGDKGLRIAHLRYASTQLHLGESRGNEFEIVLRNIKVQSRHLVDESMSILKEKGFINYFGMQRFGTSAISTHRVGIALLRNDYREAINLIMAPRDSDTPVVQDAREAYHCSNFDRCLRAFPNFHVPERSIVQRMRGDRTVFVEGRSPLEAQGADWKKYFSALPRTLRTMYVHAYQSYVWNTIATERVKRFGVEKPVIGDYVLLANEEDEEDSAMVNDGGADNDDDDFILVSSDAPRKPVKLLESEEDVQQYSIHDVTIPMPGSEVRFPESSWMSNVYREMLERDGLTPENVEQAGRQSAELNLTGDYRNLLHVPQNVSYELVRYADPNINLIQSDEDKLLGLEAPPAQVLYNDNDGEELSSTQNPFIALVVQFTLGISAYATMALREILKQETSSAHQRDLTMRGEDRKTSENVAS